MNLRIKSQIYIIGAGLAGISIANEIKQREDQLHILVNNSGVAWGAQLEKFPWRAWDTVLGLNLTAPFALTRELLPLLESAGTLEDPESLWFLEFGLH